jgi:hypothetical protein
MTFISFLGFLFPVLAKAFAFKAYATGSQPEGRHIDSPGRKSLREVEPWIFGSTATQNQPA